MKVETEGGIRNYCVSTEILVKTQFVGLHAWVLCPIEEVKFLRDQHRHIFHVEVTAMVEHSDRSIEFFVLKDQVDQIIEDLYGSDRIKQLGSQSCEMIAKEILKGLLKVYPDNIVSVSVSEDNENKATVRIK